MDEVEFDKFADEYRSLHAANIAVTGEAPEYFAEYKIRDLAREYARWHSRPPASVLDFGAGLGASVPFLRRHFPGTQITCLDVSRKSLAIGADRWRGLADFRHFDGETIPFGDASFDLVFAACVFHHIPERQHLRLLSEFRRVLTPGGLAVVFEHNPLNPLTLHAVNTCPFDENAKLILARGIRKRFLAASFAAPRVRYRVFFPRLLRALRPAESWLHWLPLGAQYYVFARKA